MEFVTVAEWLQYRQIILYAFTAIGVTTILLQLMRKEVLKINPIVAVVLAFICIAFIGNYPDIIGQGNSDKYYYWIGANNVQQGLGHISDDDIGFFILTKIIVSILPIDWYFIVLSIIYVGGIFLFCWSLSKENFGLVFIAMILNFQFIGYGSNTIRAGLASSFVLIGIALRNKRVLSLIMLIVGVSIHRSWALPVICYGLACWKDNTKLYLLFWILAIPLSAVLGNSLQSYALPLLGENKADYLVKDAFTNVYRSGFRLDFLLYSGLPVALGYYYIHKCKFKDYIYKRLYNMYLLANTCWIFVIRADFSDRFAYLSWFIYSVLLIYPIIKKPCVVKKPTSWIALIILGLTIFNAYF